MRAQEVALKEVADSRLRRLLERNKSFNRTDITVGGPAPLFGAKSWRSSPRWRGPAKISDFDDTRVAVSFQSQTFKVARFRVRKRLNETDAADAE